MAYGSPYEFLVFEFALFSQVLGIIKTAKEVLQNQGLPHGLTSSLSTDEPTRK